MQCRVCKNSDGNRAYRVKEMMFGFRDQFVYFECSKCGCLQIAEIPVDMARYYPPHYYSFVNAPSEEDRDMAERLVSSYPGGAGIRPDMRILDVGCGAGGMLCALKERGFTNLMGVDLYIRRTLEYPDGLRVLKGTIRDIDPEWDLIMFHHSFEHLADPLETLQTVSGLLSKRGTCLIRIPTVSSYAWKHYGVDWVQLDAPRHFFLHSTESIEMVSRRAGLKVKEIIYDSEGFQFWGSEQYRRGIPLLSARSYMTNPSQSIFSGSQIREFEDKALQLNLEKRGDQAAFYLSRE